MDISTEIRKAQIEADLSKWSHKTQELIMSGDKLACSVFESYKYFVLRGEFDHLSIFVDPEKISIDVGTNKGQYAMKLAAQCKGCLCIEPVKALSYVGEVLPDNCVYRNVAAGNENGTATIRIPTINGTTDFGQSSMAPENNFSGHQFEEQATDVVTIDELLADSFPGEEVGFMKIDVEGFELAVLEGSMVTLTKFRPVLQIEMHGRMEPVLNLLNNIGYRAIFFYNNRIFDASTFNPCVHRARENEYNWRTKNGLQFDPNLYVCDFIFIPAAVS